MTRPPRSAPDGRRFPSGTADRLRRDARCRARRARPGLDPDARSAIDDHVRLLLAWTAAINLTAIREPIAARPRARPRQPHRRRRPAVARTRRTCSTSGPAAASRACPSRSPLPRARTVLVESVGKKATFLATVVDALGLRPRVAVAATRAETLAADPPPPRALVDRDSCGRSARSPSSPSWACPPGRPGRRHRRVEAPGRDRQGSATDGELAAGPLDRRGPRRRPAPDRAGRRRRPRRPRPRRHREGRHRHRPAIRATRHPSTAPGDDRPRRPCARTAALPPR